MNVIDALCAWTRAFKIHPAKDTIIEPIVHSHRLWSPQPSLRALNQRAVGAMRRGLLLVVLCILQVSTVALVGKSAAHSSSTLVVVGGGAAGFFGAIRAASAAPSLRVLLLEASPKCLAKVSISGGGRCNVCHDETKDVRTLASGYPRGERALLGTFSSRFGATDAASWFRERGVTLKTEEDGRMFPTTDDSNTIVRALEDAADEAGVEVLTRAKVQSVQRCASDVDGARSALEDCVSIDDGARFEVSYKVDSSIEVVRCRSVLFATGGAREGHKLLEQLGVRLVPPVPSLFTLDLRPNAVTSGLAGVSVPEATVSLSWLTPIGDGADAAGSSAAAAGAQDKKRKRKRKSAAFEASGPCLITHKGLSGPACLRLSAFAARELSKHEYQAQVTVSWVPSLNEERAIDELRSFAARSPNKGISSYCPVGLPRRLWAHLLTSAEVEPSKPWAQLSKAELRRMAQAIVATKLRSVGKSTNKDEFVTAGGAELKQLHAHSFECKEEALSGLFLAGEVLDVDGITGGYNFLNAWASSWCAGTEIAADAEALATNL